MTTAAAGADRWDMLYRHPGYASPYPNPHVVGFLQGILQSGNIPDVQVSRALDVGCGAGRHTRVLVDAGFDVDAVDASQEAIRAARQRIGYQPRFHQADMTALPFEDETFTVGLCVGTIYYGDRDMTAKAVLELRRVLRPGGFAFVTLPTLDDWRRPLTVDGVFHESGEPDDGLPYDFVAENELAELFGTFEMVGYELTETTHRQRSVKDSSWLVTVRR